MLEVKYNGKKIKAGDIEKEFSKSIQKHIQQQIGSSLDRLKQLRCPKHHEPAKITQTKKLSTEYRFEVSACCSEFQSIIEKKLNHGHW